MKHAALPPTPPKAAGQHLEVHLRIREYPQTAMVICSDLSGGGHPVIKSGYGARAARVALGMVYGRPVEIYGPVYRSHAVEAATVRVRYAHVGQGLAWRHGEKLQGFALAGADQVFHWADAAIDGETVRVSSPNVPTPVAVRYAWAESRPWANLFNKDGLPAVPFRTDTW